MTDLSDITIRRLKVYARSLFLVLIMSAVACAPMVRAPERPRAADPLDGTVVDSTLAIIAREEASSCSRYTSAGERSLPAGAVMRAFLFGDELLPDREVHVQTDSTSALTAVVVTAINASLTGQSRHLSIAAGFGRDTSAGVVIDVRGTVDPAAGFSTPPNVTSVRRPLLRDEIERLRQLGLRFLTRPCGP